MPITIYIRDMVISGRHGIHDHEKKSPQRFKVSVELTLSDGKAGVTDNLTDTVDWSRARDEIIKIVEGNSYDLVERLAGEIADRLLEEQRVAGVMVVIDKIDAFTSGTPGVRLELRR